jgi:hypothetical protein
MLAEIGCVSVVFILCFTKFAHSFVFHDFTWSILFYNFPKSEIFPDREVVFPLNILNAGE